MPLRNSAVLTVGLVTMAERPGWEKDDLPLVRALEARGVRVEEPVWDDERVDWRALDAALIRTTWDYHGKREAFVEWTDRAAAATRLLTQAGVVPWNTDKRYLRDLERLGVRLAPTLWLERGSSVDEARVQGFLDGRRGFLKPAVGACASDTLPFDPDAAGWESARRHLEALLPRQTMLLQPFLPSVQTEGELSFVWFDGEYSHAVRKVPVPGDYRVMDDFGASDGPYEPTREDMAACERVSRAMAAIPALGGDAPLYARMDFLWDDEGDACLTELELVEPSLFFRHSAGAADRLAECLCARLARP